MGCHRSRMSVHLPILFLCLAGWAIPAGASAPAGVPGAVAGSYVGVVDLAAVLLFHPYMLNYEPAQKAFLKAASTGGAGEKPSDAAAQGSREQVDQLVQQQKELEARMSELRTKYDNELMQAQGEFEDQLAKLPKAKGMVAKVHHEQRNAQREMKFNAEYRSLQAQSDLLNERIAQATGSSQGSQFLSPGESEKKFRDLLEEVRVVTRQVAAQRGISIVLDSSEAGVRQVFDQPRSEPLGENAFKSIFAQKLPPNAGRDQPSGQGMQLVQRDLAVSWYRSRGALLEPFRNVLGGSFVVSGGYDLTQEVLAALWARYRLDASYQALILQAIQLGR